VLEIAARTGQLVYGPVLAARRHVERGDVVEVQVKGWDLRDPLHFVCDSGRVLARVQTAVTKAIREGLVELDR
jgi:hypothetical protein